MSTEVKIGGLHRDNYLVNNPIWVDMKVISTGVAYIILAFTPQTHDDAAPVVTDTAGTLRLYPDSIGELELDLAEIAKGFMSKPQHPRDTIDAAAIKTNYLRALISIVAKLETGGTATILTTVKNFIRGGREALSTNVTLNPSTTLVESVNIPYWGGPYPFALYKLDSNSIIRSYITSLDRDRIERRRVVGCNPVYLRFLNTLGGYSFWLFETSDLRKKTDKPDTIDGREGPESLGHEATYTLTLETRAERRYFKTLRALAESAEVYAYELTQLLIDQQDEAVVFGSEASLARSGWSRIINPGNSVDTNAFEEVQTFKLKFTVMLPYNPQVVW